MAAQELEAPWCAQLGSAAAEIGVTLDGVQTGRLWQLASLLRERNRQVNLTAVDTLEGILTVHVLDSLAVVPHLGGARRLADVGTGGGFPGLPLAVACPGRHFTLLDGTHKKIRFVREAIEALGLANAVPVVARAEQYRPAECFDAVIVRALGKLGDIVRVTQHLLVPHGVILAMKGRYPEDELRSVPRGWRPEVVRLHVPGLDAERHLVRLQRPDV